MLTDPAIRANIDQLWTRLWSGGLSNPLDAIEQLSYLLFLKRLDDAEQDRERVARLKQEPFKPIFPEQTFKWGNWTRLPAADALRFMRESLFPAMRQLGESDSTFRFHMENAEFKINKASLLIEACRLIDKLAISSQNQDVQGDVYEYLLSKLSTAGRNGQFRTPRHIIRMIIAMVRPKIGERICDPAAGTAGFLVNAYQTIMAENTSPGILQFDEDSAPHNAVGDLLTAAERIFLQGPALTGYDNDSGMTMLRIGAMNLMLHGILHPKFEYRDTLAKSFVEASVYDVVLANPPFKGAIDALDVSPSLPARVTKTEILFMHLFLRLLDQGGRCASIVPDGILFGTSGAHVEIRRQLVEHNRLEAVVSLPKGVFRPYSGVSTAVLIFTKGASTDAVWFYDIEHDGFTLDDKRLPTSDSDIPDVLSCWDNRNDAEFSKRRRGRVEELTHQLRPLTAELGQLQRAVEQARLDSVVSDASDNKAVALLQTARLNVWQLEQTIQPVRDELNRFGRQFWVLKEKIVEKNYDLSAETFRLVVHPETYRESSNVSIERLKLLDQVIRQSISELGKMLIDG